MPRTCHTSRTIEVTQGRFSTLGTPDHAAPSSARFAGKGSWACPFVPDRARNRAHERPPAGQRAVYPQVLGRGTGASALPKLTMRERRSDMARADYEERNSSEV